MNPLYIVIFEDNTRFIGGDLQNSKWSLMPDKPIKEIIYRFFSTKISFSNYEAYNHLVEHAYINFNSKQITKSILLTKNNNTVIRLVVDYIAQTYYIDSVQFGKEYYQAATKGWKRGLTGYLPKTTYL